MASQMIATLKRLQLLGTVGKCMCVCVCTRTQVLEQCSCHQVSCVCLCVCVCVHRSWNSARAIKYREINKITGLRGTAVNIQTMVYGNINDNSGTGVCFTRNPANGKKELFGEYLANAQVRTQAQTRTYTHTHRSRNCLTQSPQVQFSGLGTCDRTGAAALESTR